MSNFVKVNISDFSLEQNFWELNPLLRYITPFNKCYDQDNGGEYSSKQMYCVYFICDPDEGKNKFFRYGRERTIKMLKETYFKGEDWEDEIFEEVLAAYPEKCLTSVEYSFKLKMDSLRARAIFLNTTPYTMANGKDLDMMHGKTTKIMADYEGLKSQFEAQSADARVEGGRKESKTETRDV